MNINCKSDRKISAEVAVVGGGTAGVFAAISAARCGAKTVLIEKNSILGGTMTVANVNFPGLFFAWGKQIISGPCWEAVQRTIDLGGAVMPQITYKPVRHFYEQIRLNTFIFTTVLFQMCEEAGVEVLCNTMISAATETDGEVCLVVTGKEGLFEIECQVAIDATGDANLTQILGYPVVRSEVLQPATLQNRISGYNYDDVSKGELTEKFKGSGLPDYIDENDLMSYLYNNKIDMHVPCNKADTSESKTQLDRRAFYEMLKVYRFYRSVSGLENLQIDRVACETGVRETNRIVGEYIVTKDEYIAGKFYKDSVCYAFYHIDLHVLNGIEKRYPDKDVVSKVPYSALVPKGAKRILCAGRCISSDTYANSALRVEAVCMAMGQAAGCAAALAAQEGLSVMNVNYARLCKALRGLGAIVPDGSAPTK